MVIHSCSGEKVQHLVPSGLLQSFVLVGFQPASLTFINLTFEEKKDLVAKKPDFSFPQEAGGDQSRAKNNTE